VLPVCYFADSQRHLQWSISGVNSALIIEHGMKIIAMMKKNKVGDFKDIIYSPGSLQEIRFGYLQLLSCQKTLINLLKFLTVARLK
jgi:hypothetical protein